MRFFSNRLERHHSSPLVPNDISNTLQFDGGVRNILRNVDQILVLAIDHAIEARTWIGTDEDVARIFDIIGIYFERGICADLSTGNSTDIAALTLVVDQ